MQTRSANLTKRHPLSELKSYVRTNSARLTGRYVSMLPKQSIGLAQLGPRDALKPPAVQVEPESVEKATRSPAFTDRATWYGRSDQS